MAWRLHTIAVACALLAGCMPSRPTASTMEFVIVRHAEKGNDDVRDPHLSAAGLARARRLAEWLAAAPLAATYATSFRRTRQTAAPVAADHGLPITIYDAKQDAGEFATALRQRHARGRVLVVGHSNTAPAIATALCACVVEPIGDDEYDRRLVVRINDRGDAVLSDTRVP